MGHPNRCFVRFNGINLKFGVRPKIEEEGKWIKAAAFLQFLKPFVAPYVCKNARTQMWELKRHQFSDGYRLLPVAVGMT